MPFSDIVPVIASEQGRAFLHIYWLRLAILLEGSIFPSVLSAISLAYSFVLKMEAVCFSEASVNFPNHTAIYPRRLVTLFQLRVTRFTSLGFRLPTDWYSLL
jgi:hypothetical protein